MPEEGLINPKYCSSCHKIGGAKTDFIFHNYILCVYLTRSPNLVLVLAPWALLWLRSRLMGSIALGRGAESGLETGAMVAAGTGELSGEPSEGRLVSG